MPKGSVRYEAGKKTLAVAGASWRPLAVSLGFLALASAAPESPHAATPVAPASGATIGFVLTDLRFALYQTAGAKEECPAGIQIGEVAQFKAQPDHVQHMQYFGGTTQNRGPKAELANYSPLTVPDVLPWNDLKAPTGYGLNLDGTSDGHATGKTCKHDKFTSAEGEKIDNQMARVLGCVQGWRDTGFSAEFYSKEVETSPRNRFLIEIAGVDDEKNDPSVEVRFYKGRDRLVRTAAGSTFVPYMSHRIDERFPQYMAKTRGKIVDGVLITDAVPLLKMGMVQIQIIAERHLSDMRLRLKINGDNAEGILAGYEDLEHWWNVNSKSPASDIGRYSPALLYKAAHRYADGNPDPKSGQCTSISTAYKVSAVRALILHEPKNQKNIALAGE